MSTTNKATRTELIAIHKALEEVIEARGNGLVDFKQGHSDKTIAERVGCSVHSVAGLRLEMFGKLERGGAQHVESNRAKVDALCQDFDRLVKFIHEFADKHNKLAETLALNKVANVRHLALAIPPLKDSAA